MEKCALNIVRVVRFWSRDFTCICAVQMNAATQMFTLWKPFQQTNNNELHDSKNSKRKQFRFCSTKNSWIDTSYALCILFTFQFNGFGSKSMFLKTFQLISLLQTDEISNLFFLFCAFMLNWIVATTTIHRYTADKKIKLCHVTQFIHQKRNEGILSYNAQCWRSLLNDEKKKMCLSHRWFPSVNICIPFREAWNSNPSTFQWIPFTFIPYLFSSSDFDR